MRRLLTLCVLGLLLTGCDLTVPWTGEDAARAEEVLTGAPKSVRFNASLGEAAPAPLEVFVTARRPVGANVRWPNPPVADVSQRNSGLLVRVVAPDAVGVGRRLVNRQRLDSVRAGTVSSQRLELP